MKSVFVFSFFFLSISFCFSAVRLPSIFGDHMVLQQNAPVAIWGWANPNEKIMVEFAGQQVFTKATSAGTWKVVLDKKKGGPYTLVVKGENTLEIQDVLMGEVWLCSGQSNMEWPLSQTENSSEEIASASFPEIRYFIVARNVQFKKSEDILSGVWKKVSPQTVGEFSAVGYYFAKTIHQKYHFPVGMIGSYWGGTDIETWMSTTSLKGFSEYRNALDTLSNFDEKSYRIGLEAKRKNLLSYVQAKTDGLQEDRALWADTAWNDASWNSMELPGLWETNLLPDVDGIVWFRKTIYLTAQQAKQSAVLHAGKIDDSDICWVNGIKVGQTTSQYNALRKYKVEKGILKPGKNVITIRVEDTGGGGGVWGDPDCLKLSLEQEVLALSGDWKFQVSPLGFRVAPSMFNPNQFPTLLYNGMIYPLLNLSLQGVLWYQGENNVSEAKRYGKLFPTMIQSWRNDFRDPDLEFLFVQLTSFMEMKKNPEESDWASLRHAQMEALKLTRTACAVTIDIGDAKDIHPKNKKDVGYRLALPAQKIAYKDTVEYSGPVLSNIKRMEGKMMLSFDHARSGLICTSRYGYVQGFQVAGSDGIYQWAQAKIVGDRVEVSCGKVSLPHHVRYAWADNAGDANLYNGVGLPAVPFQAEVK
jgi:sialate O-acetylesterase